MQAGEPLPKEIERWNWGAFFLSAIWCIRHRVWSGLFLCLVPFIGAFAPFILGAKGNKKAWKKTSYSSAESFLREQRYWAIAGVSLWTLSILFCFSPFLISRSAKAGFAFVNTNHRLVEHFGYPIQKASIFQ